MPETETLHLIHQAARELQLEITVEPSLEQPGFYSVKADATQVSIPMGAEFKSIIDTLKAGASQ